MKWRERARIYTNQSDVMTWTRAHFTCTQSHIYFSTTLGFMFARAQQTDTILSRSVNNKVLHGWIVFVNGICLRLSFKIWWSLCEYFKAVMGQSCIQGISPWPVNQWGDVCMQNTYDVIEGFGSGGSVQGSTSLSRRHPSGNVCPFFSSRRLWQKSHSLICPWPAPSSRSAGAGVSTGVSTGVSIMDQRGYGFFLAVPHATEKK